MRETDTIIIGSIFTTIEVIFSILLYVVVSRLKTGKLLVPLELEFILIIICATLSFCNFLWGLVLNWKTIRSDLRRGPASTWRAVLSCAEGCVGIPFLTEHKGCRILLLITTIIRFIWVLLPYLSDLCIRGKKFKKSLDEYGLLTNSWSDVESRIAVETEVDEENSFIENEALSQSLLAMGPSFIGDFEPTEPILRRPGQAVRNSSDSTTDSTESVPLTRPSSAALITWGLGNLRADDGAGPTSTLPINHDHRLPTVVHVFTWREVLTTGGVPLIVYILQTGENDIIVHRYGEFRALCNRFVTKMFHDTGMEAPMFPGRRVFRKLLPPALGGYAQSAAADREFIAARAAGLGDWLQKVLNFAQTHATPQITLALLDFLKPIVRCSPDADLEQVVNTAVLLFQDTVLNPVAPPSPFL